MKKAIVPLCLIIMLVFGIFIYANRFTLFLVSDMDGYVLNTDTMVMNLSGGVNEESQKITYENLNINENIYQSGKKYYIGEKEKKNINLNYPIVSEDTSSLYVLTEMGNYIDSTFLKTTAYQNTILTEGYLYNGVTYERADESNYIFLGLNNGLYVNLVELNIKRDGEDHIIPVNSFIYFDRSFTRYYTLVNKEYRYNEIAGIQDETKIFVGKDKYTYYNFLIYLGVLKEKEPVKEEIIEEIEIPEEEEEYIPPESSTSNVLPPTHINGSPIKPTGGTVVREDYIKPEARITNTDIGVYTLRGNLNVYDPKKRIYKAPTLEFSTNNQVFLRTSFNQTMRFESVGLMPNTTYDVVGYYYYHNENDQKVKNTFFKATITTKGIETLNVLKMKIDEVIPDVEQVKINGIYLENDKDDEVLKGLKVGNIDIGEKNMRLSSGDIGFLQELQKVNYQTDKVLTSNTHYKSKVKLVDIAGNELKISGNEFEFTTLKSPPRAKISVQLSKNFTVANMRINISNPDNMIVSNFRYSVYDSDGRLLSSEQGGTGLLQLGDNNIELKNLYAESKYVIKVNCDYTDSLGQTFNNHLMDQYEFITYDVARLGVIPFTVNIKTVTESSIELGIQYTNYNAADPLYTLIAENVQLKIYNASDPTEFYIQNYNKSLFQNPVTVSLPDSPTAPKLKSNTVYKIELVPQIVSGGKTYNVASTIKGYSEFQTLKVDANVYIKNGFVASNFIDFDVCVEDTDGAIKQNYAFVKVMDYSQSADGESVYTKQVSKRKSCTAERDSLVYERIQASGIENKNYKIEIQAQEYNTTHGDAGLKSNHVMREEELTVQGTTGSMQLESLINKVNYETSLIEEGQELGGLEGLNLFDISNNTRWKSSGHQNTSDQKEIKIDSNEVKLVAYKGWRMYSYYVPELANKTYTVSFNFTYVKGTLDSGSTVNQQICITYDDSSNCNKNITSLLSDNSQRISVTIPARNSKYLSFRINESSSTANETILTLKDLKIELGDIADTTYSEFGGYEYQTVYAGTFNTQFVNLIDGENGIIVNEEKDLKFNYNSNYEYVVRYFMNNEVVGEMTTQLIEGSPEDINADPNIVQTKYVVNDIYADVSYQARLGVKVILDDGNGDGFERYYDLKTVEFTSEAETRTIESKADFQNMHMYGYYLVNTDLDFISGGYYSGTFQGTIDFQGHTVTVYPGGGSSNYIMTTLGGGGVIKNLNIEYRFRGTSSLTNYYGIVDTNYGLITNVRMSVEESVQPTRTVRVQDGTQPCTDAQGNETTCPKYKDVVENTGHNYISLMCEENYGTIENFLINLNAPVYIKNGSALGPIANAGIMKNGYAVGKYNIEAGFTNDNGEKNIGVIARSTSTNSRIENIYSMIDINLSDILTVANDFRVGNIVYSASNASIKNVIFIDPRLVHTLDSNFQYTTTYRKYSTTDALIYTNSGSSIENIYYIGNDLYKNQYTQEATISHLSNESFMSARLNSERKFNTVEAWGISIFPHLIWPASMPTQQQYNVPKKNASDMLKILSVDRVIQDKNHKDFEDKYKDEYFAKVEMSIYNPQGSKVAGFQIEGIGDSNVTKEIKIASQTSGNSDKIAMVTFYLKEPISFKSKYQVTDIYLNAKNGDNNITGLTKSCNNGKITTEYNCAEKPVLEMELYKYVSSIEDIIAAQAEGHYNFRLANDLTFDESSSSTKEISSITGVLDGDGHVITGLKSNNCFIRNLSGTLKNLKVNNYKVVYNASDYKNYSGLVCKSTTGAIVDNVHVKGISTTAGGADNLHVAGLIGHSTGTNIRNSSVSDLQVEGIAAMRNRNAYAGGLVAYASNTNISTSFGRNIKMKLLSYVTGDNGKPDTYGVSKYLAAGGLVGYLESGSIENVYATGEIDTQFGTVGGIVGETKGFVRSAISYVNIYTIGDNVGGIIGNVATDNSNVASKTLVLGDILTSAEKFYNLDRTSGSPLTANQNFAWNRQSINSVVSANTKMEELLNDEELANPVIYSSKIGLSNIAFAVDIENYNKKYDAKGNLVKEDTQYGIIPKLLHSSTGKILDNQEVASDTEVHYVELFSLLGSPIVEYWSKGTNKTDTADDFKVNDAWNGEYVKVKLQLKNPNGFDIQEVTLSDMTMTSGSLRVSSVQGDKTTWNVSFNAQADLNKNYDSYKITGVKYVKNMEIKTYRTTIKLVIPFYGRIESAEDWQLIKQGTYQNFVLANDIDLSEYNSNNVNYKISFNKLIGLEVTDADGTKRNPKIKNFTRTESVAGDCVIDTIVSDLKNVSFENITIRAKSGTGGNYLGVIKFLNGNMLGELNQSNGQYKRIYFKNIRLEGANISYVGVIALNKSPNIKYIQLDEVISMGNQRVGSFIGSSYCIDKVDIIANKLYVKGNSSYVGGFIGYENHNWNKTFTTNVRLTGVYVQGGDYTGGFGGYASGREIYVTGTKDSFNGQVMNQVRGSTYTGGIAGQYSSCYPYYNYASHLTIVGASRTGGICGYRWNVYYAKSTNNYIDGNYYVGGISGESQYTALYCTVEGGTVKGTYGVGGIAGYINWASIYDCHVGSYYNSETQKREVTQIIGENNASSYNIGGIVGYVANANNYVYYNQVSAVITGGYQMGGIVGYAPNRSESSSNYRQQFYCNIVANCVIKGSSTTGYIGGIVGRLEKPLQYDFIYRNIVSVTIESPATNYLGYIFGGVNYSYNVTNKVTNEDGTTTNVTTTITYNEPKGDVYLNKWEDGKQVSKATNIKLYENSTLNGVSYKNALANGQGINVSALTEAQLRTWSTYDVINTGRLKRASSESTKTSGLEYFPYMINAQNASTAINSITTNLPGTVSAVQALEFAGIPEYHVLPDFKVYATDVDKINIEFKEVDPHSYFTINGHKYQITQNVFTFYYDFKDNFTVTIEDNYNSKEVEVTADEVKNGVSVLGEYYYYLQDGEVITNKPENTTSEETTEEEKEDEEIKEETSSEEEKVEEEKEENSDSEEEDSSLPEQPVQNEVETPDEDKEQSEESVLEGVSTRKNSDITMYLAPTDTKTVIENATNIYGNEILLENQNIYDIKTGKTRANSFDNLTLAKEEKPLHEFVYANQKIETYFYYSTVNGKKIDKQVYVKNGQIEVIEQGIPNKKNQIMVDNYNNKNYLIYLGGDGKLYSLKDDIVFPKNFKNVNIKNISSNVSTNTDIMMVEYNDGSYTVFNYRTGQLLVNHSDEPISLIDYVKQSIEINIDKTKIKTNKDYENAKNLVQLLNQKPTEVFTNGESLNKGGVLDGRTYTIVYNPGTSKYEVYKLPTKDDSARVSITDSLSTTMDSIIDQETRMIEYYRGKQYTTVEKLSSILITLAIVLGITGAIIALGNFFNKNKKNEV